MNKIKIKEILNYINKVWLKINNDTIKTVEVGTYWKDGKEIPQYMTEAWCLIEMTNEEFNLMIKDVNETKEIKKLWGQENIEKIARKLDNSLDSKTTYNYINSLKINFITYYEKDLEQLNKPKTDKE